MLKIRHSVLHAMLGMLLLTGCSEVEPPALDDEDSNVDEETDDVDSNDDESDESGKRDAGARDASDGKKDARAPTGDQDGGPKRGEPAATEEGLPCEIAEIVSTHCAECHGDEPAFGATFSLTSVADFQDASSEDGKKIFDVADERIHLSGAKRMPPSSQDAIPEADLATLSDWLEGGAKSADKLCKVAMPEPAKGEEEFAKAGSGGAHIKPIDYKDPDLKCYEFTSYGKRERQGKYSVPTNPDFYVAFMMKAPWEGTQYIRSFRGIIDNKEVIHHWLFFKNLTPQTDGTIQENALGAHPDGEMLYGWAPGGDDMYMDPDVGMEVKGSDTFLLEAHYNNKLGMPVPDASGVEVCVTPNKPAHVAGLTWIGTDLISGTEATGVCTPTNTDPVRIFSAQPHMHVKGKHMKVVVGRKGGMQEVIHDEDFDFEYQRSYVLDVTIQPGDTITTTCTFSSAASFGKGTNDEMCYFFSNSWPKGQLSMLGIGTIIHGPNSCL